MGRSAAKRARRLKSVSALSSDAIASERLEAAGRLAGWVAHQINNPLGAISGNAQLLARRLQREVTDPDALKAYLRHLEAIQNQTERCAGITAEALSFAQPSEPEIRRVNPVQATEDAVVLVKYVHPDADIRLIVQENDLPSVKADSEWLARVLFELLSNAVQASGDRPVEIDVQAIRSRNGKASRVWIRVTDSGAGITPEALPRVFDPFFSTRDKARGLGLTLSLEMMRKMGGSLKVEQSGGSGTVLAVGVPIWGRRS